MKLWEIKNEILQCVRIPESDDYVNTETGEILDTNAIGLLQMEFNEKLENLCKWYQNTLADVEAYKAHAQKFAKKAKAAENKANSLKAYIDYLCNGTKWQAPDKSVSVAYRKSDSVNVTDFEALEKYEYADKYIKVTVEPKKAEIKEAIKSGFTIPGCEIETKISVQIR